MTGCLATMSTTYMGTALLFAAGSLAFLILIVLVVVRSSSRSQRLRVLQRALESDSLSERQKQELIGILRADQAPARGFPWGRLAACLGWLGMFAGGLFAAFAPRHMEHIGIIFAVMSFAVLSLPLVLRETEDRRAAAPAKGSGPR